MSSFHQFWCIAYNWRETIPEPRRSLFKGDWMKKNILQGHGPLCASYKAHKDGRFRSEGDSPSFMHQIDVGLRSLEDPSFGGWGGRFRRSKLDWGGKDSNRIWRGVWEDRDIFKPIWRWAIAFQNDWAARADWCVKSYEEANHPPVVTLDHASDLKAKAGETVNLSAKGTDPDGDKLTYKWWQYKEPGSHKGAVEIKNATHQHASFVIPNNAGNGETIHIICNVTDNGTPPLTRYRRVIVELDSDRK